MQSLIFLCAIAYSIALSEAHFEKTTGQCYDADGYNNYCQQYSPAFYLYTTRNPSHQDELKLKDDRSVKDSSYDPKNPTVFITHGYNSNDEDKPCTLIRNAYLQTEINLNVIVVNWNHSAGNLDYIDTVVHKVRSTGEDIGDMIQFLANKHELDYSKTILSGHGVGAHIMGIAGYKTGGKIKAIFGLDPAKQGFEKVEHDFRISKEDAKHVQIIHTNLGDSGINQILGHIDFVVNDGVTQRGCRDESPDVHCSHRRAAEYFAESINSKLGFWGKKCDRISEITYCRGPKVRYMGGLTPDSENLKDYEVYGVESAGSSPYALGKKTQNTAFMLNWFQLYYETFSKLSALKYGKRKGSST